METENGKVQEVPILTVQNESPGARNAKRDLTATEQRLLDLLCASVDRKEICRRLGMTMQTLKNHGRQISLKRGDRLTRVVHNEIRSRCSLLALTYGFPDLREVGAGLFHVRDYREPVDYAS